jgi:hypothetical protein
MARSPEGVAREREALTTHRAREARRAWMCYRPARLWRAPERRRRRLSS